MPADRRSVLFSVAHSKPHGGALPPQHGIIRPGFNEYDASLRASLAAFRHMSGMYQVELYDVGDVASPSVYARFKMNRVNQCRPAIAIEIHCNAAADPKPNYGEVIYYKDSIVGRAVAEHVAAAVKAGFAAKGMVGPWHGARANTVALDKDLFFFLEDSVVPAIIVEGMFISNPHQAVYLSTGGAEDYGIAVADGVMSWLRANPA